MKFKSDARIRLSCEDTSEDERCTASIKIKHHGSKTQFTADAAEKVLEDIEIGYWRIDLMPNEQALHNALTSIGEVATAEDTPMHTLIVRNPLATPMTPKDCKERIQLDVPNQELERVVGCPKDSERNTR